MGFQLLLVPLALLVLSSMVCNAAEPGLDIADALTSEAAHSATEFQNPQRIFVELAASNLSQAGWVTQAGRASLDYLKQADVGSELNYTVSGRLDEVWKSSGDSNRQGMHTLRELLVEWQGSPNWVIEAGRINAQIGEAIAFNPTDLFREGSLRNVTSVLPTNLRKSRQGSVMLRAQRLWGGGAVTVIGSPQLAGRQSINEFSLDLAATNPRNRWLITFSQKLGQEVTPQLVFSGGEDQASAIGLSVSWLPFPEVVAYVETSLARRPTTLASIGAWRDDTGARKQIAGGGTWSVNETLSLNIEFDIDETAPDTQQMRMLTVAPAATRILFEQTLRRNQVLPYQRQWFITTTWNNLLGHEFDLRTLSRINANSGRGQFWLESRKRFGESEFAAQLLVKQENQIQARSNEISLIINHYF